MEFFLASHFLSAFLAQKNKIKAVHVRLAVSKSQGVGGFRVDSDTDF